MSEARDRSNLAGAATFEELLSIVGPEATTRSSARPTTTLAMRRRRGAASITSPELLLKLIDSDGVLRWEIADASPSLSGRRRRRGLREAMGGSVLTSLPIAPLEPNDIATFLRRLDRKLNANSGLRRIDGDRLMPAPSLIKAKRVLVLVHGTFSRSEALIDDLRASASGTSFLEGCAKRYDHVLAFDHPTLSVSPVLNAIDLDRAIGDTAAEIDVIAHSRGGLVARWWAQEVGRTRKYGKLIFVGTPLAGTSLAAPRQLRESLDHLANLARVCQTVLGLGAAAVPLLAVATGLMQVVASILSAGGRAPLADAGIAMIPGLMGQSRISNNVELDRLRVERPALAERSYAVLSEFEPADEPWWKFWRIFAKGGTRVLDLVSDSIFDGANDLVVDTASMGTLWTDHTLPASRIRYFPRNDVVHHCNYFRQEAVVRKLGTWLEL